MMKRIKLKMFASLLAIVPSSRAASAQAPAQKFDVVEAKIADIHKAILERRVTSTEIVQLYLERIRAFNGRCVDEPNGVLGPVTPIGSVRSLNALITINLRPAARLAWGLDDRNARSMTDAADSDPAMPDALETAAELDAHFASTGKLKGPLHGVVFSIKDVLDTFDMRTTSGADADYANDRPPSDATLVKRLREAGAIILAKANLGEYASGSRSAFGGTMCNPYDTMRDPGGSSGGSASSVAANLVTCSISEEGSPSIRMPSRLNNIIGLSGTQGLVSRAGMIGAGPLNDRNGPACRTVEDAARVLDVIAGYDEADELTAFSTGRIPLGGYTQFAQRRDLSGVRIGVLREYMNKALFTEADHESIEIVERALGDLQKIGATIVDPGPDGNLLQQCLAKNAPHLMNATFIRNHPELFPDGADHIERLIELNEDPSYATKISARSFGSIGEALGESKYYFNRYLKRRGDANIRNLSDLISKSRFYVDEFGRNTRFRDVKSVLEQANEATTLNVQQRDANRFAIQQMVLHCMRAQRLDAFVYPTGNIPPTLIKNLIEPDTNGRSHQAWTLLGQVGFPAITVPAGFTTKVYDRIRDKSAPGGTRLGEPTAARTPVGVDFVAAPFDEPRLIEIAAAYEAYTRHREPPENFGPVVRE